MVGRLRYLAEKKQSENVIYLVEEPETFLHPSSQEEMLYSLMSLSKLNQIFVTTHSPIFTWATKQNAITLCKKENTELKYEQREDDDFLLDIAKQLWIRASHNIIDTTTSFIFLEGKDDISFFAIAYEKFSWIKFPYDKVCILFWWWNTLDDFIRIKYFSELKDKHQKKLFLVVDSDKWNNEAKKIENNKRIVEKFNNKVSWMWKGWVLNKRYIESYYHKGALERIFTDKDFSDLIKNVFDDDFNVIEYLNSKWISVKKSKWNADIFLEMTQEEWTEVSSNELEGIFSEILPTNE